MCETPSAQSWIVILSQTSSRSRFANIDATKLCRLFCTDRFRSHRCWPKKRRHFVVSEEAPHAIVFQGREGSQPTSAKLCRELGETYAYQEINVRCRRFLFCIYWNRLPRARRRRAARSARSQKAHH